jgi:hypothetical protein
MQGKPLDLELLRAGYVERTPRGIALTQAGISAAWRYAAALAGDEPAPAGTWTATALREQLAAVTS